MTLDISGGVCQGTGMMACPLSVEAKLGSETLFWGWPLPGLFLDRGVRLAHNGPRYGEPEWKG